MCSEHTLHVLLLETSWFSALYIAQTEQPNVNLALTVVLLGLYLVSNGELQNGLPRA